jgi:hypothetical protein
MGASFRYANVDSLGMSWLPLPRFGSRVVVWVAVSGRGRGDWRLEAVMAWQWGQWGPDQTGGSAV